MDDFKANITEEQKVGVAVGVMLENNKAADVSWVREEVKRAADEREGCAAAGFVTDSKAAAEARSGGG